MATTVAEVLDRFAELHPAFADARRELARDWSPDSVPPYVLVAEYARAFVAKTASFTEGDRARLFAQVETWLETGSGAVADLAAVGFLEALQHTASAGDFHFREIAEFLGARSRAYCKAWDEFTGAATPGL